MAPYSHKGHDMIRYDITQNIAIRYDTIQSESASPDVRIACCQLQTTAIYGRTYSSKQATAHNTGAPSFCLSTLSPLAAAGAWILADRRGNGWWAAGFFEVHGHSAGLL